MEKRCVVLFSGGLDSSLTACDMIENGYDLELLHFNQGSLISNGLARIRKDEIQKAYPLCTVNMTEINVSGLFRRLALTTLEEDIIKYRVSLVCVGCKLAMHIGTIIFCKNHKINAVADGSTKRQERYGEQRLVALEFLHELYEEYGLTYSNPIYYKNKTAIKYGMFDRGLTIQPLEDTCLFSHTFKTPSDEIISNYLLSKKIICKELIERGISYEKNR